MSGEKEPVTSPAARYQDDRVLSARALREDGATYVFFGVGVERFFEAHDPHADRAR